MAHSCLLQQCRRFARRIEGTYVFALTVIGSACTFYTGTPSPPAPSQSSAGAATTGGQGTGGKSNTSSGTGAASGDSGEAGRGDGPPPWVDATGDLAGRGSSFGGVVYLAANQTADLLVAGVAGIGLWATADGGESWRGLGQTGDSTLISHWVTSIVFDPEDPNTFWETGIYGGGGVFKSGDNGVTTQQLGAGMVSHNDLVSVDFADPERKTLLAGWHELRNMLWRSHDAGETWDNIGADLPDTCGFSSNPLVLSSDTYLLGCMLQIVRTADGGASWDVVSKSGGFGPPLVASDGTIYWRIDAAFGLMRSEDEGLSWERVTGPGIVLGPVYELPDGRLVSMNEKFLILSADRGQSWDEIGTQFPAKVAGFVYSNQQRAFFAWTGTEGTKITAESVLRLGWDYETE